MAFILVTLKDIVRIPPSQFDTQLEAIEYEINKKYMNTVSQGVGLFISMYDVLDITEGFVYPNDGGSHVRVRFRLITFRPFAGQILVGKAIGCSEEGIQISLNFFDNVYIQAGSMMQNSKYDAKLGQWVWSYFDNGYEHELPIEMGKYVRLRVERVEFSPPSVSKHDPTSNKEEEFVRAPMLVFGTFDMSGLGRLTWWAPPGAKIPGEVEEEHKEDENEIENGDKDNETNEAGKEEAEPVDDMDVDT
mmetsp:Transcript_24075/g.26720  ORF Transcript_24075/g.26720 Transcript_24075/m.26720 type:complete len:247 (+) Transcript_24075:82-822(+)